MVGKKRRMNRIVKNGRTLIVPMDHGITKPAEGLEDVDSIMRQIDGVADAVVLHKGVVKRSKFVAEMGMGLIVHLSASTCLVEPNDKRIITSVEKAIELGADAVSIHINIGSKTEGRQLSEAGMIAELCDSWGMPLLAMIYARGEGINEKDPEVVKHAVRVGYEIGADIVKTAYTGSPETFAEVVDVADVPIVVAGGSKVDEFKLLKDISDAISVGAIGAAVGRNVFQHRNPMLIARALRMVIHENAQLDRVKEVLYEGDLAVSGR
jgi:predicted phospho-2-dehydro-3-deoxyheptonate aldolase